MPQSTIRIQFTTLIYPLRKLGSHKKISIAWAAPLLFFKETAQGPPKSIGFYLMSLPTLMQVQSSRALCELDVKRVYNNVGWSFFHHTEASSPKIEFSQTI